MDIQQLVKKYIYWPEMENSYQKNIDFSKTKMKDLVPLLKEHLDGHRMPIDNAITRFYTLNEALALLRQKENNILDEKSIEIYKSYHAEIETLSKKIFSYLVVICTMEARHCLDFSEYDLEDIKESFYNDYMYEHDYDAEHEDRAVQHSQKQTKKEIKKLLQHYKKWSINDRNYNEFVSVHNLLSNVHGVEAYERHEISNLIFPSFDTPEYENLNIKDFLTYISHIFENENFEDGYGGHAWKDITQHALKFVKGELNAEVFVDQAFSLEHNNGNIFNKDVIFTETNFMGVFFYDQDYGSDLEYTASVSQFLLNLQHKGLLLSFFNSDWGNLKGELAVFSNLGDLLEPENFQSMIKNVKSIPAFSHMTDEELSETLRIMYSFSDNLVGIHNIKYSIQDVYNVISEQNLSLPYFDINKGIDDLQCQENDEINISDSNKLSGQILNHLLHKTPQNTLDKTKSTDFAFEIFDTKSVPVDKMTKEILGNKAFGLAQMNEDNLPVPRAMVFPATNSHSFFNDQTRWLEELEAQLPNLMSNIAQNKLCSVRSGAAVSMPGMMDTILNVGIDDSNYDYFCETLGQKVTDECAIKFMKLFIKSVSGHEVELTSKLSTSLLIFREFLEENNLIPPTENEFMLATEVSQNKFPLTAQEQYKLCIKTVFSSWYSERAMAYRNHNSISHEIGTAAIVQEMVFGNLNNQSCTGVVFSRDCINGKSGIIGEFLPNAQGEDVVSGAVTPKNITELQPFNPEAYQKLTEICEYLEKKTGDIQDIEFTIENGELYILQKRKAVCSTQAQQKLNEELYKKGLIDKDQLISSIKVEDLTPKIELESTTDAPIGKGLVANPGVMRGIVIRRDSDMRHYAHIYEQYKNEKNFGWIFYSEQTSPDHAPIMIKTHGFVTSKGGFTSHAAILARSWDKPCVVGINDKLSSGQLVTVDANNGKVYSGLVPLAKKSNREFNKSVKNVLKHFEIEVKKAEVPKHELVEQYKSHKTWMQEYPSKIVKPPVKPVATKFLNIGNKIALMLIKENAKNNEKKLAIA